MVSLDRFDTFKAVVEAGSLTAAADLLGQTRAVVSFNLKRLEAELGVTLLTRSTRQLALTDAGERFYQRCVRTLDEARLAIEDARSEHSQLKGTLRITTTLEFALAQVVEQGLGHVGRAVKQAATLSFNQVKSLHGVKVLLQHHAAPMGEQIGQGIDAAVTPKQRHRQPQAVFRAHMLALTNVKAVAYPVAVLQQDALGRCGGPRGVHLHRHLVAPHVRGVGGRRIRRGCPGCFAPTDTRAPPRRTGTPAWPQPPLDPIGVDR